MTHDFQQKIESIIWVLRNAGYDPYVQLYGYVLTGKDTYITRKGNARTLVTALDREQLWEYIKPYIEQKMKD